MAVADLQDVRAVVSSMTLAEKIGQVCSPILQSSEIPPHIERAIAEYGIGILRYCPNADYDNASKVVGRPNPHLSPSQQAELLNRAQDLARSTRLEIPLLVSIDQEGGTRNDFNRNGALVYGSHMAFGAADDADLTRRVARASGEEIRSVGINLVQAPIVDILHFRGRKTIKAASFGASAELVTRHAVAMLQGFRDSGLAVMLKHFPTYGSSAVDAHKGMARITKTLAELEGEDYLPYRACFAAGADAVMIGHVIVDCLDDSGDAATVSRKILTGELREKLGFDGLVMSDAMRMSAIQEKYGTARACVLALKAGCDALLLRGDERHFLDGYQAVADAFTRGELDEAQLDESVRRILTVKRNLRLSQTARVDPSRADRIVGSAAHAALAREIAARSVALVRRGRLPWRLPAEAKVFVVCAEPSKLDGCNDPRQPVDMLPQAVRAVHPNMTARMVSPGATEPQIAEAVSQARQVDAVIVGTVNAILHPQQVELVRRLADVGKPLATVAIESPYDVLECPQGIESACTFGAASDAMMVAAEVIFGRAEARGKPPVELAQ